MATHQQEVKESEAATASEQRSCATKHNNEVAARKTTVANMRTKAQKAHAREVKERKEHRRYREKHHKKLEPWLKNTEATNAKNEDNRQNAINSYISQQERAEANNADKCKAAWEANRAQRQKAIAQKEKEREAKGEQEPVGGEVPEGAGGGTSATTASVGGLGAQLDEAQLRVAKQIMEFWIDHKFPATAAAGFVGNVYAESTLHVHEHGGGLYQQSGYPASYSAGTVDQQSEHVREHLGAWLTAQLKAQKTAKHAAYLIMRYYEKPEGSQPGEEAYASVAKRAEREEWAQWALGWWKGGPFGGLKEGIPTKGVKVGEHPWQKTKAGVKLVQNWEYAKQVMHIDLQNTYSNMVKLTHEKVRHP